MRYFKGTTDAGSSLANRTYIDVNVHWIDQTTFKLKKKTIHVMKVDSKTAVDYRAHVYAAFDDFGIKEKTDLLTTDNEPTMDKCFPKDIRNDCFSHIDSKASQKALENSVRLKMIRKKLRTSTTTNLT